MEKVYIYQKHDWDTDFYIRRQRLTRNECYCPHCKDYDTLMGVYDNEAAFSQKLQQLFDEGYDVVPSKEYNAIRDKSYPPARR